MIYKNDQGSEITNHVSFYQGLGCLDDIQIFLKYNVPKYVVGYSTGGVVIELPPSLLIF